MKNQVSHWHEGLPIDDWRIPTEGLDYWARGRPLKQCGSKHFSYEGSISVEMQPCSSHFAEYPNYDGLVQLEVEPTSSYFQAIFAYEGDISCEMNPVSAYGTGQDYLYDGLVEFTQELCSTYGEAMSWSVFGDISFEMKPEASVVGDYGYVGEIALELDLTSGYCPFREGWDAWSGYGLVDLTFLQETPPYFCVAGDLKVSISPTSVDELYKELLTDASAEAVASFPLETEFQVPPTFEVEAIASTKASGEELLEFLIPPIFETSVTELSLAAGTPELEFVGPEELPLFELTLVEAVASAGSVEHESLIPSTFEVVARSRTRFLDAPQVEHYAPPAPSVLEVTFVAALAASGSLLYELEEPRVFNTTVVENFVFRSPLLSAFSSPPFWEITAILGLEAGGSVGAEAPVYETWVLTGLDFDASIYSNWNFNSYASFRGRYYALAEDGLYLLEGDTDDGVRITPGVALGLKEFGTPKRKHLRAVYFCGKNGSSAVQVDTGEKIGQFKVKNNKAAIAQDLRGERLAVSIHNFEELSSLRITLFK